MFKQAVLLSLLEASQTAVESSDKALKAAEVALSAAKIANEQAKATLKAVTEAFVQEDQKLVTEPERRSESEGYSSNRIVSIMDCETDEDTDEMEDFLVLSTNKNPITDIDDEIPEDSTDPNFILVSCSGPAADHQSDKFGVYRLSEDISRSRTQSMEAAPANCTVTWVSGGWHVMVMCA